MDQQENKAQSLDESLRIIFENSEIYVNVVTEAQHQTTQGMNGAPFMVYMGPERVTLKLKIKQRTKDFVTHKRTWDEAVFMELIQGAAVFQGRNQSFNAGNSDIMLEYTFHVFDYKALEKNLAKYSDELFNKQFTAALESKLLED